MTKGHQIKYRSGNKRIALDLRTCQKHPNETLDSCCLVLSNAVKLWQPLMKIMTIAAIYSVLMLLYARTPALWSLGDQGKGIFDDKLRHGDELLGKLGHNQAAASSNGEACRGILYCKLLFTQPDFLWKGLAMFPACAPHGRAKQVPSMKQVILSWCSCVQPFIEQ